MLFFHEDLWKKLVAALISPSANICKTDVKYHKTICSKLYQEIFLYLGKSYIKITLAV